jgi:uncharacterized protein (DUF1501 family)
MLEIGRFPARTCRGLSRRSFLQLSAALPTAWAVQGLPNAAHAARPARAKSVILLWLWGGPSHLDTFDPKPDAPIEVRGPLASIETRTPGLRFSELLPRLAATSQLFNVVHSHTTFAPGHPDAGTFGLTGFAEQMSPVQPNFGSIVAKHRGNGGDLPPFVSVGRGIPRDVVRAMEGFGGGALGKGCDPLVNCTAQGQAELPSLELLADLTPHRMLDRRALLRSLDASRRELDMAGDRYLAQKPIVEAQAAEGEWSRLYERAYGLLTNQGARAAFDLSGESARTREAYGQTSFGQSCLLARRLIEWGVSYIQVNWSQYVEAMTPNCDFGWDTHIFNFELLQDRHCPILDRALTALLVDLEQRGLLSSTLVVAMGEFGRGPRITHRASREHWPRCYSSLWAGAGMTPGRVIGASDKQANDPATTPITPLMVGTTIAELTGIDTQARAEMKVLDGGKAVDELLV